MIARQRFQDILENLEFTSNGYDDKSDKGKALYVLVGNIYKIVISTFPSSCQNLIWKESPF